MASSAAIIPFKAWARKSALRVIHRAPIAPIPKWRIVTGDLVYIRSGRSGGLTGKVKAVLRKSNRVVVEGANFVKRHVKPTSQSAGGVVGIESPVPYSKVNLVDPTSGCVTGELRASKGASSFNPPPPPLPSAPAYSLISISQEADSDIDPLHADGRESAD